MTAYPVYINGMTFPDAATAAAYHDESYDIDSWSDMFPNGLSECLSWLRYNHPELTDTDINTLAAAVHAHATRPDQDVPLSASLRRLVQGVPIYVQRERPAWEDSSDNLATLPPSLQQRTQAHPSLIARMTRIFTFR